jgi:hypothetical protein
MNKLNLLTSAAIGAFLSLLCIGYADNVVSFHELIAGLLGAFAGLVALIAFVENGQ